MAQIVLPVIVGLLGGIAIGFQNPLASLMGQRVGAIEGAFIIHIGGAAAAFLPVLALRGGGLGAWRGVPWYALGAGVLGVIVITAVSYTIPRIGVAATVVLVVGAQLVVSVLVDHFGVLEAIARPLDLQRLAGIVLLIGGAWLVLRP